jgi:cytochrome b6-f complex iron-sulfur subunit
MRAEVRSTRVGGVGTHQVDRTRRDLLRTAFWVAAAGAVTGGVLAALRFGMPPLPEARGGVMRVPVDRIPRAGDPPLLIGSLARPKSVRGFYLVHLPAGGGDLPGAMRWANPGLPPVSLPAHAGLLAVLPRCTHLGCAIPWSPEFVFDGEQGWFRCGCHGATFNEAGVYVFGPAPRSLDTLALGVERDGSISVNTRAIRAGAYDNPSRAVLYP